ncbi:type II toxin-antitoxin system HicB family antitoxin [Streptomyces sp. NPDC047108]|uniref:type II toxin-antitoxin system HicB family antitoxin n=1 Tax=Streptomyces sp. NPDC047108 TaxID=3155025 RepID=UPI0033DDD2C6
MTAYRVNARRSGDWWALEVPDLPGVFSQAKRLDSAARAAAEAIAVMTDADAGTIDVDIVPELDRATRSALADVARAKRARAEAEEVERQAMRAAAVALTNDMSQRDAGRILGVSFQRISQLLALPAAAARKARGSGREATKRAGRGSDLVPVQRSRSHERASA